MYVISNMLTSSVKGIWYNILMICMIICVWYLCPEVFQCNDIHDVTIWLYDITELQSNPSKDVSPLKIQPVAKDGHGQSWWFSPWKNLHVQPISHCHIPFPQASRCSDKAVYLMGLTQGRKSHSSYLSLALLAVSMDSLLRPPCVFLPWDLWLGLSAVLFGASAGGWLGGSKAAASASVASSFSALTSSACKTSEAWIYKKNERRCCER